MKEPLIQSLHMHSSNEVNFRKWTHFASFTSGPFNILCKIYGMVLLYTLYRIEGIWMENQFYIVCMYYYYYYTQMHAQQPIWLVCAAVCVCANNATSTIILNLIVFSFLCCTTILCMTEKQDWKSDINLMKAARQFPELMMFAMSTSIKRNCLIIFVSAFHGVTIHHKMNLCDCNWQILIWRTVLHFGPLTYKYNYHCCHLALVNAKWLIKMH